jgi:hypothetical protein
MSEVSEHNFRDFHFHDNVSQLAGGLLPELAERAGMEIEGDLTVDQLGQLVGVLGKNKTLRDANTFLTVEEMATYAIRAHRDRDAVEGEERPIDRSLNDPERAVPENTPRVMTGAVANWYDFSTDHLVDKVSSLTGDVTVHLVMGTREMKQPTELANKNHQAFRAAHNDQLPTEQQYGEVYIAPRLEAAGYKVEPLKVDSQKGEEIAEFFVANRPELFLPDKRLSAVRTSISALQLVLQMRRASRVITGNVPELFFEAAARPIAINQSQVEQPIKFQAPQPASREAALDGKLLLMEQLGI